MSNAEPKSPLTIIAIFAGIIEASALASLPFLGEDSQGIYTWFLVGFPPFLTLLFFLTLNFNSKSLYMPEAQDVELASLPEQGLVLAPSPSTHPGQGNWRHATGESLQPTSTIILSGVHSRKLARRLLRQTLDRESEPVSLVLKDLDAGTQTTIVTQPL